MGVYTASESVVQTTDSKPQILIKTSFFFHREIDTVRRMLDVTVKMGPNQIIPRRIVINLDSGEKISLIAESISDPRTIDNTKYLICNFLLSERQGTAIQDYKITALTVSDPRQSKSINLNPYPGLLKEQVACITWKLKQL